MTVCHPLCGAIFTTPLIVAVCYPFYLKGSHVQVCAPPFALVLKVRQRAAEQRQHVHHVVKLCLGYHQGRVGEVEPHSAIPVSCTASSQSVNYQHGILLQVKVCKQQDAGPFDLGIGMMGCMPCTYSIHAGRRKSFTQQLVNGALPSMHLSHLATRAKPFIKAACIMHHSNIALALTLEQRLTIRYL